MRAVGLMAGTSLDGIDVAYVDIATRDDALTVRLLRGRTVPLDHALLSALRDALPPAEPGPRVVAALDRAVGNAFACAARAVIADAPLDFVASHGITLYHDGEARQSVQIGDPFVMRDALRTTVISDFRRADCAAGGEGAPLMPYVDAQLLRSTTQDVVALNLGGIANISVLPRGGAIAEVTGWDTGPANMVLDAFVRMRTAGRAMYDADGTFARAGHVDEAVLRALLAAPYFARRPPKSTGGEQFGASFWERSGALLEPLSLADGCATLTALSARTAAAQIRAAVARGAKVVVSGGGARNPALVAALTAALPGYDVCRARDVGIDDDFKEAMGFALLGFETLRGRAASIPGVTGASASVVLGSIVPFTLAALLAKMQAEATAKNLT